MPFTQGLTSSLTPTDREIRVGLIGAGDRLRRIYLPILRTLAGEFDIVGFTTRSPERAGAFAAETGIPTFPNAAALATSQRPDLLVVAVTEADVVLPGLLDLGIPLLVETPFCWNLRTGRKLLERIRRSDMLVGVAEQTPFLPIERLKRALIEVGALGQVIAAQNDFAVYSYHGIAVLRAYAGGKIQPARVNAVEMLHPTGSGRHDDEWVFATAVCKDGVTFSHQFSDMYFDSPLRFPRSLRLYGTGGAVMGSKATFEAADGRVVEAEIQRELASGRLTALLVDTPLGEVRWSNPFRDLDFDDEQIAVATLLRGMRDAVLHQGAPPYGAEQGLADMEMVTAMRYSSLRDGMPVHIPLGAAEAARYKLGAVVRRFARRRL